MMMGNLGQRLVTHCIIPTYGAAQASARLDWDGNSMQRQ